MKLLFPAAVVLVTAVASAPAAARPSLPGHPLLVDRAGLRVFGPALRVTVPCPRLLPLPADALATAKRAVRLAMPPFARRLDLDGRDPRVEVGSARRSGFIHEAAGCGRRAWARSVVASVFLPHVDGASLSQHTFAVGRVPQGWVLWGTIH